MKIGKGMVAGLGIASLLIALPAGAQGSKESAGAPGMTGGATAGGTASAGGAGEQQITGKVEKVDQSKKELSLRLKVSDTTQVMKDGKTATLSDIKEGDQVRASFDATGEPVRIDVTSSSGSKSPSGSSTPSGSTPSGSSSPGSSSPGGSSGRGY